MRFGWLPFLFLTSCGAAASPVASWTWSAERVECNGLPDSVPADGPASCEWSCSIYNGVPHRVTVSWDVGDTCGGWCPIFLAPVVETGWCD